MNPAEVLRNQEAIYKCALAFRKDANQLMALLSAKFGDDLATLERLTDNVYRQYNFGSSWQIILRT